MIPRVLGWRRCKGQKLKGSVFAKVGTFQQVGSHVAVRNPTQAPRRPGSIFTRVAFPSWPTKSLSVPPLLHGATVKLPVKKKKPQKAKLFGITPARFSRLGCAEAAWDWRPAPRYQRELQAKVQVCSDGCETQEDPDCLLSCNTGVIALHSC